MKSYLTHDFIACFRRLPRAVRDKARKNYRLWLRDSSHPSLQFKPIHSREPIYSVRIGISWRALGLWEGDTVNWFWIGSHADYEKLIAPL